MDRPFRCKVGLHRLRMVHYSAFEPFLGGQIFATCTRCYKYKWEVYDYWDVFRKGVTYYNNLESMDKFYIVLKENRFK